jgi:zinc-ribbon domain
VYCPRCGTPNEPGDRFCSSCGASLGKTSPAPKSGGGLHERLGRIAGETRRARLLTAGTALAVVVAIAGFIALSPDDEEAIPRDAYTLSAERICLGAKRQIVAAERSAVRHAKRGAHAALPQALVPIVASWRAEMVVLKTPEDRIQLAGDLNTALRDVEIQMAKLALVADMGDQSRTLEQARRVDAESAGVETAIASLGLEECAGETIGFGSPS